ncbi:MAG: hypothetical protein IT558_01030 [Alphaproteobacteria bacterium]|nr:hypothetical protein [Alphaproteobacteria bacterium]
MHPVLAHHKYFFRTTPLSWSGVFNKVVACTVTPDPARQGYTTREDFENAIRKTDREHGVIFGSYHRGPEFAIAATGETDINAATQHVFLMFYPEQATAPEFASFIDTERKKILQRISAAKKQPDPALALLLLMADYNADGTVNVALTHNPHSAFHASYVDGKDVARHIRQVFGLNNLDHRIPKEETINRSHFTRHKLAVFAKQVEEGSFASAGYNDKRHDVMCAIERTIWLLQTMDKTAKYSTQKLLNLESGLHAFASGIDRQYLAEYCV